MSICNRYSETPIAVTEYLGLTKGTVSQSLKVLESKGMIVKKKDGGDKRMTHLVVTQLGKGFLQKTTPPKKFSQAIELIESAELNQLSLELKKVLSLYQLETGIRAFGQCRLCKDLIQDTLFIAILSQTKLIISHRISRFLCLAISFWLVKNKRLSPFKNE